jgi:predicted RNA polymerase sigma factor
MRADPRVAEAAATVQAIAEQNGNVRLAIRVQGLAPAADFASEATVYVVWTQPRDGARQNVGAVLLSSERRGRLDTVTPHRRFQVTVTPERSGQVTEPTQPWVFEADIDRLETGLASYF